MSDNCIDMNEQGELDHSAELMFLNEQRDATQNTIASHQDPVHNSQSFVDKNESQDLSVEEESLESQKDPPDDNSLRSRNFEGAHASSDGYDSSQSDNNSYAER